MSMDVNGNVSVQVSVVGTAAAGADGIQIGGAFVFTRSSPFAQVSFGAIAYCNNIIICFFLCLFT